jgi:glycosyltransferase involved in cell wall biosynthesis
VTNEAVIAVLTFKRPEPLRALLPELVKQAGAAPMSTGVLVVDNDPEGSAAGLVAEFAQQGVRYVNETRPGIAAARNRALDESPDERLLIFIDDDERPIGNWLDLMIGLYLAERPTAVVGPVISEFDVAPDAWVRAGDFFRRRRLPTGTEIQVAATNNLLLDMKVINGWNVRFDEKFGISGGSDTLFTRAIVAVGGRMVWCDEAIVIDQVPASRTTRRWVLLRALRSGNGWSRVSLHLADSFGARLRLRLELTAAGGVRALGGAARYAVGFVTRSTAHRAKGLRTAARGVGMVSGAYGYVYQEYRRKGGSG